VSEFNIEGLFEQARALQKKVAEAQERLAKLTVQGQSGGGMVTAVVNGRQQVVSIKLEPQCVDARDIQMLQDLIVAAINQALTESRALAQREMGAATGLPGMSGFPTGFPF